jgi:hypothetical protein
MNMKTNWTHDDTPPDRGCLFLFVACILFWAAVGAAALVFCGACGWAMSE